MCSVRQAHNRTQCKHIDLLQILKYRLGLTVWNREATNRVESLASLFVDDFLTDRAIIDVL